MISSSNYYSVSNDDSYGADGLKIKSDFLNVSKFIIRQN